MRSWKTIYNLFANFKCTRKVIFKISSSLKFSISQDVPFTSGLMTFLLTFIKSQLLALTFLFLVSSYFTGKYTLYRNKHYYFCKIILKNQLEYSKYSILTNENKLLAEMTVFHFIALKIKLAWIIKVFSYWICSAFKYF